MVLPHTMQSLSTDIWRLAGMAAGEPPDGQWRKALDAALVALSAACGNDTEETDGWIAETFARVAGNWRSWFGVAPASEALYASVGNVCSRSRHLESLAALIRGMLSLWDRSTPPPVVEVTIAFQTWRSVAESRLKQEPISYFGHRRSPAPRWLQRFYETVREYSSSHGEGGKLAALTLLGGVIRGYITSPPPTNAAQAARLPGRRALEDLLLELVVKPLEITLSKDWEECVYENAAFILGHCVPWMVLPAQEAVLDARILLSFDMLVHFLIESPHSFSINAELGAIGARLRSGAKEGEAFVELEAVVSKRIVPTTNSLWTQISRISNAAALLVRGIPAADVISASERIRLFVRDLFITWEHCPLSAARPEQLDTTQGSIMNRVWHVFKTTLFSLTAVLRGICDDWFFVDGGGRAIAEPETAFLLIRDIFSVYSHFHFVTVKFGTSGFSAYHEVVDLVVSCIRILVERQIWHHRDVAELWVGIRPPSYHNETETDLSRTRTLFYLNMSENVAPLLPNDVYENDILPLAVQYLRAKNVHPLLFEAAHVAVLAVLVTETPAAAEFSSYYADLVLEEFPSMFTTEQLRAAYGPAVQAASGADDALAEELIGRLLLRIDMSASGQPHPARPPSGQELDTFNLRAGLAATLFDQICTVNLSLLPWLFDCIRRVALSSSAGHQMFRDLYENISGNVDSTRRTAAVKFYLDLTREAGIAGAVL